MTTVRIDLHPPADAARQDELRRALERQPGRDAAWAGRLLEQIRRGPSGKQDALVCAAEEGRAVGVALVLTRQEAGDAAARPWLAALWVEPELRGRGLGRRLVEVAERHAREHGATELVVTVSPDDDATLFLGERWGFSRERVLLSRAL